MKQNKESSIEAPVLVVDDVGMEFDEGEVCDPTPAMSSIRLLRRHTWQLIFQRTRGQQTSSPW